MTRLSRGEKTNWTNRDLEIGLLFLERAYDLVKENGRIGIVLPETYFFSTNYRFVLEWIRTRLKVEVVANVPMEAFQGFCRAKTNFYVFRKCSENASGRASDLRYSIPFLNPKTCGIYKDGKARFKIDTATGKKSKTDIDNELIEAADLFAQEKPHFPSRFDVQAARAFEKGVLVPTYFDTRYNAPMERFLKTVGAKGVSLGELIDRKVVAVRTGHGSPGNDQRTGTVPYIKVSDIRALRMNVNPTNMIPRQVAEKNNLCPNPGNIGERRP